jgi:nickel transport protein
MNRTIARTLLTCGLLLAVLSTAGPALAHKVSVYAYVENGQIKGEGYFAGGDKAQNCPVEVYDAQGGLAASAQTNAQGEFSLPLPTAAAPPLKIILRAGQGHQGDYTLTAADLGAAETSPAAPPPAPDMDAPPAEPAGPPAAAQIEQAVERAVAKALGQQLDQRLAPLTAQVAKLASERAVSLQDVIGGLGYILGLLGLAAYLKSRQGSAPPQA